MLHLALPPSEGALSNELKSAIVDRMYQEREGFLHACEELKVSKARALAELKADKAFKLEIERAREMLAEWHYEEAISLSDRATGREDTPAIALRVKTRLTVAEQMLKRLQRPTGTARDLHLHQHQGDTFYISEEKREKLQAQRERLLATSRIKQSLPMQATIMPTESDVSHVQDLLSEEHKIERKSSEQSEQTDPGEGEGRGVD